MKQTSVCSAPLMVWSITDRVIEDPKILEKEFRDISEAGFGGVAAFVRCSRYSWDDPDARKALSRISTLCQNEGLDFWFGPDPRFVSHKLVGETPGIDVLLFGDSGRAEVFPNLVPLRRGRFTVRCAIPPRHVHTLTDVAIDYHPVGLERVYAIRVAGGVVQRNEVRDITRHAHFFYNARDRYIEAFGSLLMNDEESWRILAFFHVRTNHVDFSDDVQMLRYESMLRSLKGNGCRLQGVMWDEPGFTCTYGSLPISPRILSDYRVAMRRSLESDLWKLAVDADDGSHIPVRERYYSAVQESITRSERRFKTAAHRIWGPRTIVGIHDTWHFESADMCDMNHGSLDLWKTVRAKSGGFVDLGAVQLLKEPDSSWYRQFAAMTAICATLGKMSDGQFAYNNLWTVGDDDGDGSQREAMNHCVTVLAQFGIRWLAHAYGPVGTIGQERTFLGSPPLPGYPEHSTWQDFPGWNTSLARSVEVVNGSLPSSNVLVLFPVETMYALADKRADRVAEDIFDLILRLLDNQYQIDVIATTALHKGFWGKEQFHTGHLRYEALVFPHSTVVDPEFMRTLKVGGDRVFFVFDAPRYTTNGKRMKNPPLKVLADIPALVQRLSGDTSLRPVHAPGNSWVTLTRLREGTVVSLAPSRCGGTIAGAVGFAGKSVRLKESVHLQRILFPRNGEPRILPSE